MGKVKQLKNIYVSDFYEYLYPLTIYVVTK